MKTHFSTPLIAFGATLLSLAPASHGALIAQYLFENNISDSNGSATTYDLSAVGANPAFQSGTAGNSTNAYVSDGVSANYLSAGDTFGSSPQFTVSIWIYTTNPTQDGDDNKGFFSNNTDSSINNSWQLAVGTSSSQSRFEFKTRTSTNNTETEVFGTPQSGVWENIVLQKTDANDGQIWLNGVQVGGDLGYNPGGLQQFRVGTNRAGDSSFDGLIDSVQIWEGENVSAATIFANGVNVVPEPSAVVLGALGSLVLLRRRR